MYYEPGAIKAGAAFIPPIPNELGKMCGRPRKSILPPHRVEIVGLVVFAFEVVQHKHDADPDGSRLASRLAGRRACRGRIMMAGIRKAP
jgi:hypothetical protein